MTTCEIEPGEVDEPDAWLPRLFVIAKALEPDDEDTAVYPDEVVVWGMAFPDHAMTYDRDPVTRFHDHGSFDSADRALRRFSRVEPVPLRIVWL